MTIGMLAKSLNAYTNIEWVLKRAQEDNTSGACT